MTNKEKRQQLLSNELTIFEVEGLSEYYFLLHTLPYGNENEYTIKSVERVEKEKGRIFGRDNKTMVIDKITPTTIKMFTFSLLDEYIKASIKLSNITIKGSKDLEGSDKTELWPESEGEFMRGSNPPMQV